MKALVPSPRALGRALRDVRRRQSLTQQEVADLAGVRQATVSNAEQGLKVSLATIFRILSVKDLPAEDLRIVEHALTTILKTNSRDTTDAAMPMFFSPLRKFHPRHVGPVWLQVWRSLVEIDHKRLSVYSFSCGCQPYRLEPFTHIQRWP